MSHFSAVHRSDAVCSFSVDLCSLFWFGCVCVCVCGQTCSSSCNAKDSFNIHLFNYEELNRAHEKTTIRSFLLHVVVARRHLKCYAESSLKCRKLFRAKQQQLQWKIIGTNRTVIRARTFRANLQYSMLNSEFTSARTDFDASTIFHLICINLELPKLKRMHFH